MYRVIILLDNKGENEVWANVEAENQEQALKKVMQSKKFKDFKGEMDIKNIEIRLMTKEEEIKNDFVMKEGDNKKLYIYHLSYPKFTAEINWKQRFSNMIEKPSIQEDEEIMEQECFMADISTALRMASDFVQEWKKRNK